MALERMNMLHCGLIGHRAPVFGKVRELLSDSVSSPIIQKLKLCNPKGFYFWFFFFLLVSLFSCFCFVLAFCNANQEFLVFFQEAGIVPWFFFFKKIPCSLKLSLFKPFLLILAVISLEHPSPGALTKSFFCRMHALILLNYLGTA